MKTAEELPVLKMLEIWRKECPDIAFNDAVMKVAIKYSDQQLAEFKRSVITLINTHHVYGETTNLIKRDEIIKSIEQL